MTFFERLFGALYASECWYADWLVGRSLYGRTRAIVVFDRVLTGELDRAMRQHKP